MGSSASRDINYGMEVSDQYSYLIVRKGVEFRFGDWFESLDIVYGSDTGKIPEGWVYISKLLYYSSNAVSLIAKKGEH